MPTVTALGALIALIVAIFLILKKSFTSLWYVSRGFSRGLIGGADLSQTVSPHDRRGSRYHYRSQGEFSQQGYWWSL